MDKLGSGARLKDKLAVENRDLSGVSGNYCLARLRLHFCSIA
jgi:hypothetical protein